jgi:hypothetical protein
MFTRRRCSPPASTLKGSDDQMLRSPVLAATSQLVAIEADSALGPVMCGDWRTASRPFKQRRSVHGTSCMRIASMWTVATQPLLSTTARLLKHFLNTAHVSRNSTVSPVALNRFWPRSTFGAIAFVVGWFCGPFSSTACAPSSLNPASINNQPACT